MSYTGETYIKKLNEEEDAKRLKQRIVSECCMAEVTVGRTMGSMYDPPEPYYVCLKCDNKCDVFTLDESEDVNEQD